jgi:hypothetical protein
MSLDELDRLDALVETNRKWTQHLEGAKALDDVQLRALAALLELNAREIQGLREEVALLFLKVNDPALLKRKLS